jgi:hypothetical protein
MNESNIANVRMIGQRLAVIEAMLEDVRQRLQTESSRVATSAALSYALCEVRTLKTDLVIDRTRRLGRLLDTITYAVCAVAIALFVFFAFSR